MMWMFLMIAAQVKTGGIIFTDFNYTFSEYYYDTSSPTLASFDVSRIYLNADINIVDNVKAFLQLENNIITKEPATNKSAVNDVYLKNAELQIKYGGVEVRFGLIPTPWRGYEEKIWKHRFVSKIFEDIELGIPATDRGLKFSGKLKSFEFDGGIYNGEGTKSNESNKYKDFLTRTSFEFVKGLKANLFYLSGRYNDIDAKEKFFYGLSYESGKLNLMGTIYNSNDKAKNQSGYSIHSVYSISDKYSIYARYDFFDSNLNASKDSRSRLYFGAGYRINENVRSAVNYLLITPEDTLVAKRQDTVSLNLEIKF